MSKAKTVKQLIEEAIEEALNCFSAEMQAPLRRVQEDVDLANRRSAALAERMLQMEGQILKAGASGGMPELELMVLRDRIARALEEINPERFAASGGGPRNAAVVISTIRNILKGKA